jgi:ribosomal protein S18 acetylase RimI-like enzyme
MTNTEKRGARKATPLDLQSIVTLHESAFAGFLLTMLGGAFLRELYRGFIMESDGICWIAESELAGEKPAIVGFVAGTLCPKQFFRRLLFRRGFHFALAALPGMARHPLRVLPRVLSALWYRGDKPSAVPEGALLSSLGVNPNSGRRGIGKLLVSAFCEEAAILGAPGVYLITDRDNNDAVNTFYEQLGFHIVATGIRRGRSMNTYLRAVGSKSDHEQ